MIYLDRQSKVQWRCHHPLHECRIIILRFHNFLISLIDIKMSPCKISWMNLPCLPFRQVVDELVDSLGLRKVLTLRLVNGTQIHPRRLSW